MVRSDRKLPKPNITSGTAVCRMAETNSAVGRLVASAMMPPITKPSVAPKPHVATRFTAIASAAAGVLDVLFPGDLLQSLFGIATFIPGIALGIRRMHDIGKSGWWLLVGLIPIIGWIVLIVWLATKSDAGSNQWGVTERA